MLLLAAGPAKFGTCCGLKKAYAMALGYAVPLVHHVCQTIAVTVVIDIINVRVVAIASNWEHLGQDLPAPGPVAFNGLLDMSTESLP